jgi:hypothetical protein
MAPEQKTHLTLALNCAPDSDPVEVDDLTGQLRRRLLELDVENVEPVRSSDIPAGAKSIDAAAIGALTVTMSPAVISAVIGLVKSWMTDRPVRTAKLTIGGDSIELTHASSADQERLVRMFLERQEKNQLDDER